MFHSHVIVVYANSTFKVFDNYAVTVMIGGEPYTLGLFDTAGQEDFEYLRTQCYDGADLFIILCTADSQHSLQNVR